jgi:signal transduction histidine kinase
MPLYLRFYLMLLGCLVAYAIGAMILWHASDPPMPTGGPRLTASTLFLLASVVALAAFPFVRSLTRRLERLQQGTQALAGGHLGARVAVEGGDEIARLAGSFNEAAARIEQLVGAHKALLAHTSHELRTPLARIRVALALAESNLTPDQQAGLARDIGDLDRLIGDILLASRLEALPEGGASEPIDLLALVAEECAHYPDTSLDGAPCSLRGDRPMLRSMVRNLLDNAHLHGHAPIEVTLDATAQGLRLFVADRGGGVPMEEREQIFDAFHRRPASQGARGTGLGLSLVRQIARQHGGQAAWVGDGQQQGVEVLLPAQETATQLVV